jgi:hypothetical protein
VDAGLVPRLIDQSLIVETNGGFGPRFSLRGRSCVTLSVR